MRKNKINIGDKYGYLTIIKEIKQRISPMGVKKRNFLCRCDCGNEKEIVLANLTSGATVSCGCYQKQVVSNINTKHGYWKKGVYCSWQSMKNRCNNSKDKAYNNYGARGISVCKRWNKFENFLEDMGERPKNMTLDRIDNNGNYEPANCRWATPKEQQSNMRSNVIYKGETASNASRRLGGNITLVTARLKRGWSLEDAFTIKPSKFNKLYKFYEK